MKWTEVAVLAGVSARVACALAGPGAVRTDAIAYRAMARSIAEGHGIAPAPWMPGWPVWMSLFFRAGLDERAIVAANAILSIATIALAAAIAKELGRDAHVTAAATALVPSLATMPRLLVSENLAVPLFALATLLLVRASKNGSLARWAAFSVVAALATYVREASLALIVAAIVIALAQRSMKAVAVVVTVFALALAPWALRRHGLSTSDGSALCIGLGDGATGGYRANVGPHCALRPSKLVTLAPAKLARLFAFDDWTCDDFFRTRAAPRSMRAVCNFAWWALLAASFIGLLRKNALVIVAVIGAVALSIVVTFGVGRFHAPIVPLLGVLCYRRRS